MSKHDPDTNPDGTPAAEIIEAARRDARRRHPAGRRFVTSGLLAVGILAAVPGVASASPVLVPTGADANAASQAAHARYNHPDIDPAKQRPTCTHGQVMVGATCEEPWLTDQRLSGNGDLGPWGVGILAAFALIGLA